MQLLNKRSLLKVLFYCPESDYYYESEEVMRDLLDNKSRPEIFRKVKQLINSVAIASVLRISEVSYKLEKSNSLDIDIQNLQPQPKQAQAKNE